MPSAFLSKCLFARSFLRLGGDTCKHDVFLAFCAIPTPVGNIAEQVTVVNRIRFIPTPVGNIQLCVGTARHLVINQRRYAARSVPDVVQVEPPWVTRKWRSRLSIVYFVGKQAVQ
jgi:hypothetical protein